MCVQLMFIDNDFYSTHSTLFCGPGEGSFPDAWGEGPLCYCMDPSPACPPRCSRRPSVTGLSFVFSFIFYSLYFFVIKSLCGHRVLVTKK